MTLVLAQDVEVDPVARVTDGVEQILRGVLEQAPQVFLGIVILVLAVLFGRGVAYLTRRALTRTTDRSASFVNVMSRVARSVTIFIGALLALVIAIPSVDLGAVIGGLGITSVALGFAFKDILQNTLAGLLLLFRQPFAIGDQIEVVDYTGTVEAITIRETRLRTFDGQRILIPNSDVYSSSVRVQTAYPTKRSVIAVGVDYEADLKQAQKIALQAVSSVDGVMADPGPEALYTQLNTSTIDFDVRYWCSSRQWESRIVQSAVVIRVTNALNAAGIKMPADIIELDARVSFAEAVKKARAEDGAGGAADSDMRRLTAMVNIDPDDPAPVRPPPS